MCARDEHGYDFGQCQVRVPNPDTGFQSYQPAATGELPWVLLADG